MCSQSFVLVLCFCDLLSGIADHSQYIKGIAAQPEHLQALLKVQLVVQGLFGKLASFVNLARTCDNHCTLCL